MNTADRKRANKARDHGRRESAYKAAMEYQSLVEGALRRYEHFHELPEGTSTVQRAENTSAGLIGWVKYWEHAKTTIEETPRPAKVTVKAKLADCSFIDDVEFPLLGENTPGNRVTSSRSRTIR